MGCRPVRTGSNPLAFPHGALTLWQVSRPCPLGRPKGSDSKRMGDTGGAPRWTSAWLKSFLDAFSPAARAQMQCGVRGRCNGKSSESWGSPFGVKVERGIGSQSAFQSIGHPPCAQTGRTGMVGGFSPATEFSSPDGGASQVHRSIECRLGTRLIAGGAYGHAKTSSGKSARPSSAATSSRASS
jgi:hypothetical protein